MSVPDSSRFLPLHIALKSYCQRPQGSNRLGLVQTCVKLINASLLPYAIVIGALLVSPINATAANSTTGSSQPTDSSWPREKYSNGTRLIIYQPQIDDWKNFQDLSWRMAISLTPKGGKTALGVVEMKGNTDIDNVAKVVNITNSQITGTYFPSLDN